jgi:hypothetical protein
MEKSKKLILQILNLLTFIAVVIVNGLANIIPIGGRNTGELSDAIPNLFVPAGLTFSIWGVIYFLLALFSIYQMRDIFKSNEIEMPYLEKISYYFIIGNLANFIWIFFWHYVLIPLSLVMMLILLVTLLQIYRRLDIGGAKVSRWEKIAVHVPFSVYLGWISVATVANITAVLVEAGVADGVAVALGGTGSNLGAELWTILVIIVVVIITFAMILLKKDTAYSLVIVWALFGIWYKQSTLNFTIAMTALIALIIISVGIVYNIIRWIRK